MSAEDESFPFGVRNFLPYAKYNSVTLDSRGIAVGRLSVHIETFGCQMNVADSERAATKLRAGGFDVSDSADSADVILLNTCSIREKAEQKVFQRVGEIKSARGSGLPLIGVMGCVAQLEGEAVFNSSPAVRLVIGTGATDRIKDLLERAVGGERRVIDVGERMASESYEISSVERHSRHIAFVPIIEGCNKFCTYCIVPFSRGREKSRAAYDIVEEVKRLRDEGFKRGSIDRAER